MSPASPAPCPLCKGGAPTGNHNAVKSAEKFFKPYTWVTGDNPEHELTDEELVEVRGVAGMVTTSVSEFNGTWTGVGFEYITPMGTVIFFRQTSVEVRFDHGFSDVWRTHLLL